MQNVPPAVFLVPLTFPSFCCACPNFFEKQCYLQIQNEAIIFTIKRGFMRSASHCIMFILPFYTIFRNYGYNLEYVFCQQSKHKSSILLLALFWWKISRHECFRDCNECMFVWNFLFSVLPSSRLKVLKTIWNPRSWSSTLVCNKFWRSSISEK